MSKFDFLSGEEMPEPKPQIDAQLEAPGLMEVFDIVTENLPEREREALRRNMEQSLRLRAEQIRNEAQEEIDEQPFELLPTPGTIISLRQNNLNVLMDQVSSLPDSTRLRVQGLDCAIHRSTFGGYSDGCPVRELIYQSSARTMTLSLHHQGAGVVDQDLSALRRINRSGYGSTQLTTARNQRNNQSIRLTWCRIDGGTNGGWLTFGGIE